MEKTPVTVWIYASQASRFDLLKKRYREEERATFATLRKDGMSVKDARITLAEMRATEWPSFASIVADAVEARLSEPDLAGPWRPLSKPERQRLALSGRWPGPATGQVLKERNYDLPSPLVERLRTAAWRVSEEPLRKLEQRGLLLASGGLTRAQHETRARLVAQLYPVPRIIREALEMWQF